VTSGSDRKLAYWDALDGSQIREIDGSLSGAINGMDISPDGKQLVTAGADKLVKVSDEGRGRILINQRLVVRASASQLGTWVHSLVQSY